MNLQRPLPEEMFFYARSDTHFLLYIYDNLRNELVEKSDQNNPENDRIENVLQRSKGTSLIRHEKQVYELESGKGPGGWYTLLTKTPQIQTSEQLAVFRAIHRWRDEIARNDDDSVHFVMSNQVLASIAKRIPTDLSSLYSVIHPISHNVKSRIEDLLHLIEKAKIDGAAGPTAMDILKPGSVGATMRQLRHPNENAAATSKPLSDLTKPSSIRDVESLTLKTSVFWGKTFGGGIWDKPDPALKALHERLTFAVPMPPQLSTRTPETNNRLVLLGSNEGSSMKEASTKEASVRKIATLDEDKIKFPSQNVDDSAFVLRNNRKRKSDAIAAGIDPDEGRDKEIIALDKADEETLKMAKATPYGKKAVKALKKAQREEEKAAKKAERAAKKARRESAIAGEDESENMDVDVDVDDEAEVEEENEVEEEDFDYSKAESVLHSKTRGGAKNEKKGKGKDKKKPTTPFDPYTKSANAPKGMRRQQTAGDAEKGGRSMTFKN